MRIGTATATERRARQGVRQPHGRLAAARRDDVQVGVEGKAAEAADCRVAAHWWQTPAGSFQHTWRHTHSVQPRHWWNWSATSSAASRSRWSLVTPRVLLRPYCANMPTCWIRDPISPPSRLPPSSARRPPKLVTAGLNAER